MTPIGAKKSPTNHPKKTPMVQSISRVFTPLLVYSQNFLGETEYFRILRGFWSSKFQFSRLGIIRGSSRNFGRRKDQEISRENR